MDGGGLKGRAWEGRAVISQGMKDGLGAATLFGVALVMAWLMVRIFEISYDRALLVETLWLVTVCRYQQVSHRELVEVVKKGGRS